MRIVNISIANIFNLSINSLELVLKLCYIIIVVRHKNNLHDNQKLQEKCGILAVYTNKPSLNLSTALLAGAGLQHRGQQGAGLSMMTTKGMIKHTGSGLLRDVFKKRVIRQFNKQSLWTMIHLRYGTFGSYDACNLQPTIAKSDKGEEVAVIHNGEFVAQPIKEKLRHKKFPKGVSDTYLFTEFLAATQGKNWDEKIVKALSNVSGAYSLIIGVGNALYIARDNFGIRPLVIGKLEKGGWIVASETFALNKINIQVTREIKKGEIIRIDQQGITTIKKGSSNPGNFCDFEWAYFSRPNSIAPTRERPDDRENPDRWISYSKFRERCGEVLAREAMVKNASFVVGVPDSGLAVAAGYAKASKVPYSQVIIRDHFDPNGLHRLFMRDDQMRLIGKKVLGKLSLVPDRQIWRNAIVVIADDSIVRGNVSRRITKAIFALGAAEVHWMVGFPPVAHPCHLGVSMRSEKELIAHRFASDPKKIARAIHATSVNYISPKGFITARKLSSKVAIPENPKEIFLANGGCAGCITGLYPVSKEGQIYPRYTS